MQTFFNDKVFRVIELQLLMGFQIIQIVKWLDLDGFKQVLSTWLLKRSQTLLKGSVLVVIKSWR